MNSKPVSILLVEDDYLDIMHAESELKKLGLNLSLHVASNGLEALNQLLGEDGEDQISPIPRLILLDINMPKMNGIDFLKAIRSNKKLRHLNVFILTSSDAETDQLAAQNTDVNGYFVKPLSFELSESSPANAHSMQHMLDLLK